VQTSERLDFGPIDVEYDATIIVPRPWTLAQSTWAAELSEALPPGPLLELYCGAGHIGLAAARMSGRTLVQVDDDACACAWARRNAARLAIDSDVRCGSVESVLLDDEQFPLVVADPPYLRADQVASYPHDPVHAIDGGPDGLGEIRRCIEVAAVHLAPDGVLLLQVRGARQRDDVAAHLAQSGHSLRLIAMQAPSAERAVLRLEHRSP